MIVLAGARVVTPGGVLDPGTLVIDGDRGAVAARLADGSMAGSLLTLDQGFRNLVRTFGLDLSAAVRACSTNSARAVGLDALGSIVPGALADLAVLDNDLRVIQAYVGGRPQL
jgi:N-acetylglucosamine-6-phosphate deacetylase